MKKILLFVVIVMGLFGYMTYGWMQSNGWTFFSQEGAEDTATTTPELSKGTTKPLLFSGDIMLGRYVETLAKNEQDELRSFRKVQDFLKEHVTIANLEGPIPANHKPTLINGMSFSFPSSTPRVLKEGGVAAVSLANNHMFDQESSGWEETKRALDQVDIAHFGGYAPEEDYFQTTLGDVKVVVYGLTTVSTEWNEQEAFKVTKKLRMEHPEAYLIVFMHWGNEYVTQSVHQRELAHKLIDLGVDAITGAHPHVVQGIELYNGKPIFYSLGNFIFDQYWRKDLEDGFLVRLSSATSSYQFDLIPIHSVRSVPYIATSTKRDQILSNISKQSSTELKDAILSGRLEIRK